MFLLLVIGQVCDGLPFLSPMDLSRYISRQQLIKELDIDPSTLWRWEQQGKIKRAGGIGNKVYYSRRHIEYVLTKNL
jgi:hypothetical protein